MILRNKIVIPHRPSRGFPRGAVESGVNRNNTCNFKLFLTQASTVNSDTVQEVPVCCEEVKRSSRLLLRAGTDPKVTVKKRRRGHFPDSSCNSNSCSCSPNPNSNPNSDSKSSNPHCTECSNVAHLDNFIGPCNVARNRRTRCLMCPQMSYSSEVFYSSVTHRKYSVLFHDSKTLDCTTRNVIYLITCTRCKMQYVGELNNSFLSA